MGHMIELGILGLDTSHAERFADYIETLPYVTVISVWDSGMIRDDEYIREFCKVYGVDRVERPTELVGTVDGVLVLSVNWDEHVSLAKPHLESGLPVLIDKPLAGSMEDLDRLAALATDARLFGGSALPYHPEIDRLPKGAPERSLFCVGYDDPFYYGAHLADLANTLTDSRWLSVTPCDHSECTVSVEFEDGTHATLRLDGPEAEQSFGVLDVTTTISTARVESSKTVLAKMYPPYLDTFLQVLRGNHDPTDRLLDGARLLLAINAAIRSKQVVTRTSGQLASVDIDGGEFAASYEPYY